MQTDKKQRPPSQAGEFETKHASIGPRGKGTFELMVSAQDTVPQ